MKGYIKSPIFKDHFSIHTGARDFSDSKENLGFADVMGIWRMGSSNGL